MLQDPRYKIVNLGTASFHEEQARGHDLLRYFNPLLTRQTGSTRLKPRTCWRKTNGSEPMATFQGRMQLDKSEIQVIQLDVEGPLIQFSAELRAF